MTKMQVGTKLEVLPNEIFLECFEYLNAPEIFYSFDQLNYRFSELIRTIPLHLNCQYARKSIFDQFCMRMSSAPEIKTQIRSLHLSNDNTCLPIQSFLSYFSLEEFSHLRSLTLTKVKQNNMEKLKPMLPLIPELTALYWIDRRLISTDQLFIVPISKLRTLSLPVMYSFLPSTYDKLFIKNLTISTISFGGFCVLFRRIPMLQTLHVQNVYKNDHSKYKDTCFSSDHAIYFTKLRVDSFYGGFDDLIRLLKQIPNLTSLIISAEDNRDMIDARRWEDLITSSLPHLIIFNFKFNTTYGDDMPEKFEQFQSDFWQKQHRWYTEYALDGDLGYIYTIPYISNRYILTPHTHTYGNQLINNVNTFDHVSELILHQQAITLNSSSHFSNVTSLTLNNSSYLENVDEDVLRIEDIHSLQMIVNLSNVKHLTISPNYRIESSSVLFQLLKETSQLSSIKIRLYHLQSFFNNDDLCKYLNKMISKLDIYSYPYESFSSYDQLEKFCQIFSNLQQLICYINGKHDLLFLFNHLSKLSIMKIYLSTSIDRHGFTPWLEEEARKLQLTIYIEFEHAFSQTVHILIGSSNLNSSVM